MRVIHQSELTPLPNSVHPALPHSLLHNVLVDKPVVHTLLAASSKLLEKKISLDDGLPYYQRSFLWPNHPRKRLPERICQRDIGANGAMMLQGCEIRHGLFRAF